MLARVCPFRPLSPKEWGKRRYVGDADGHGGGRSLEGMVIRKPFVLISVVQWHPFFFFLVAAPLKMVFPKKGSLFLPGSLNN